jgi:hypothetical protein
MMDRTPTRRVLENSTSQNDDNASLLNSSTFHGTVSLSMPEDEDNLSPLHCFIRKFGIEAFVVSNNDAQDTKFFNARNFKVKPGIVGMQCMHCKNKPLSDRGPKSVHYPSSTKCIYYSMENWQRHHAMYCASMPKWILRELKILMSQSKTGAGGRRRYWADSAIALGMEDTPEGIIFVTRHHPSPMECRLVDDSSKKNDSNQDGENSNTRDFVDCDKNDLLLIGENDRLEISEYLFLLLSQMEACSFSEEDRSGSRSKVKDIAVGYPGIQCKHCHGKSGVGRYFPISLETLTLANSDRNIHNHLQKCRRCPVEVKENLDKLRLDVQNNPCKIKRGARKAFFSKLWYKLHSKPPHGGGGDSVVPFRKEYNQQHYEEEEETRNSKVTTDISNHYYHPSNSSSFLLNEAQQEHARTTRRNGVSHHLPPTQTAAFSSSSLDFLPCYPPSQTNRPPWQHYSQMIPLQRNSRNSGGQQTSTAIERKQEYSHNYYYPNQTKLWPCQRNSRIYPSRRDTNFQQQYHHPDNKDWWWNSTPHPNRMTWQEEHSQQQKHDRRDCDGENSADIVDSLSDSKNHSGTFRSEDLSGYAEL